MLSVPFTRGRPGRKATSSRRAAATGITNGLFNGGTFTTLRAAVTTLAQTATQRHSD